MELRIVRSHGNARQAPHGRPDVRPETSDRAKTSKTKISKAGQNGKIRGHGERGTFFFQRHISRVYWKHGPPRRSLFSLYRNSLKGDGSV